MSTETVKKELKEFFKSNEPGVFVLKGKWGVGKTYLVDKVVEENHKDWKSKKYARVSLFGVNSIEELTGAIFVEMRGSAKTVKQNVSKAGELLGEISSAFGIPSGAVNIPMELLTKTWISKAIPNSKIVIDDIERRGDELSIRYLLGFLSQLKEQKNCQTVLIFNEGELDEETQTEFNTYREKVVDRELELAPSVDEIIELGFKKENDVAKKVLRQLEVDNIRAVQKIEKFLERLEPFISHFSHNIQDEVVRSAVRLGWFYFVRNSSGIPWSFVKEFETLRVALSDAGSEVEEAEKQRLTELLKQYGYMHTGRLEEMLIGTLEKGFHNQSQLEELLNDIDKKVKVIEADRRLRRTWNLFHVSFDDTEQEFVEGLIQRFEEDSQFYAPSHLETAVVVLEDLGRENEADKVIRDYFSTLQELDPSFLQFFKNERVCREVKARIPSLERRESVIEIFQKMFRNLGFNQQDVIALQSYSEEDWLIFFKEDLKANSNHFKSYVKYVLDFGTYQDTVLKQIAIKAAKALKVIESENKLNKVRLAEFKEEIERLIRNERNLLRE